MRSEKTRATGDKDALLKVHEYLSVSGVPRRCAIELAILKWKEKAPFRLSAERSARILLGGAATVTLGARDADDSNSARS
jgi:hypothetical protein